MKLTGGRKRGVKEPKEVFDRLEIGLVRARRSLTLLRSFSFSQPPRSCKEARQLISKPASGYFYIQDNSCDKFKVYCDFTSEPGWAWTLVMSESLQNVGKPFTRRGLFTNEPMSPEVPNWEAYRLQLDRMKGLRSESTHWRITCSLDLASVVEQSLKTSTC